MGVARGRLGHRLTAVGLNVLRLREWCLQTARAKTRLPPFARLLANAPAAETAVTSPAVSLLVICLQPNALR
jgi:hypothetical protein